jgi:HK97 family phage major capsid protein
MAATAAAVTQTESVMDTFEAKEAIAKLSRKLGDIDELARKEKRPLTAKEAGLQVELEEAINEARLYLPANGPITFEKNREFGHHYENRAIGTGQAIGPTGRSLDFRSMFNFPRGQQLDTGGFKDAAEFLRVLDSGRYDPRLDVRASMGEGTPSSGGFSVPTQFASEWLDASLPTEIVRNLCRVFPMTSESLEIPGWDAADMSAGATHGGLTMTFLAEGSSATTQAAKMRKIVLSAKMAGIYVDASIELVQDGRNFAENLQTALRQSIGYGIDRYCLTGTGAGCPLGVLNSACKIQVAAEGGQQSSTVVYANLKKLFSRALNPDKSVFLFTPTAIPELLEQSVSVGVAGSFVPLLNESNGKFTIFGRPVYFHPAMPALGDADDCAFVDFNFFALGLRQEVAIDITDAARWLQRERSFRVLMRFDGMCTLDAAVQPENGDTLSPVVTLAAR